MIKHFCDVCKQETTQRVKVNITAKEVHGEGYLQTTGKNLMDVDYECCSECYNKLVDIVNTDQEESPSIFDKLKKFIKNRRER